MMEKNQKITLTDRTQLNLNVWMPNEGEAKGILQVIHGMGDHSLRYTAIGEYFSSKGYVVVADDHRGHGNSVSEDGELGHLNRGDSHNLVHDEYEVSQWIKDRHPHLPLYVLGHSMGSFILRAYLKSYGDTIAGAIICGSSAPDLLRGWLGMIIAKFRRLKDHGYRRDKFLNTMAFTNYNSKYENVKTDFDWICSDPEVVEQYIKDPYCGTLPTSGFFHELSQLVTLISKKGTVKSYPSHLPIMIIGGADDPLGEHGKGLPRLKQFLQNNGVRNVTLKLYDGGRHEILNEVFKEAVYQDVYTWITDLNKRNE
ncbi:alpha/beta hydrolase [Spirochaeta cellobiosiphila]|uniref:alpha/beta hydrolase n=1 Tax=Spirochaeta cellobiosiphila TaxID=504483 RepID=UPI00040BA6BA|nr:alpha/beta hydrolase [Spirochaeta cellobiosiphila]